MPRDMVGWPECLRGLVLTASSTPQPSNTHRSFPSLTAWPHPLPCHSWQGKSLTVLRTFLYCRIEEEEGSNVFLPERGGKPVFDETSCVAIVKLGLPQSEVRVACCCLSHGLGSDSHVLCGLLWNVSIYGPHKSTNTESRMVFTLWCSIEKNSTFFS